MFPFVSVLLSCTDSGVVLVTLTFAGLLAGFATMTELTDAATAEPQPVTNSTTVATDTIVTTVKPHLRNLLMKPPYLVVKAKFAAALLGTRPDPFATSETANSCTGNLV